MNLTWIDQEIVDATLEVEKGETLNLNLASFSSFPKARIVINVHEGASFMGAMADFSKGNGTFSLLVNLLGEGANCSWHLGCIGKNNDRKIFDISANHRFAKTDAVMSSYGIVRDASRLTFTGTSLIEKGSVKSSTLQEAKIIVFDKDSDGKCSPILRIDENDVTASHAATVGKLNEDHLFYLLSNRAGNNLAQEILFILR